MDILGVMPLDDADIRAVLDAATVLAGDAVPSIESVLDLLRSLIPSSSASFNDMAFVSGDYRYTIVPPDDEVLAERLKPEYDRYAHQHPLITQAQLRPGGGAIRFCDVPGGDSVTDTDLYRNFFEPFNIRYQLAIQLPAPPDVIVGYALNRSGSLGEFSDRDVGVLNALGPHLTLHHRMTMDREQSRAVTAEADRDGWVVVTVRSDGIVQGSSTTSFSPSLTPGGCLPPSVAALLPGNGNIATQASSHDVEVGDERWRCVVNPVAVGPTVLLVRRLGDETGGATTLVDFGLTPRQAEVAIALATTGGTNSQLARHLAISEGTVKKHLESVFRVLAVDSRAAAIVALGELADGTH